jgi:hypothetical protein
MKLACLEIIMKEVTMIIIVWKALHRDLPLMASISISNKQIIGLSGLQDREMMRNLKDL